MTQTSVLLHSTQVDPNAGLFFLFFFPNEVQLCSKFFTLPFSSVLQGLGHSWRKYHLDTYQTWPFHAEENQTAGILFLTFSWSFLGGFVGIEIECDEVDEGKEKLYDEVDEEDTLRFSKSCGLC